MIKSLFISSLLLVLFIHSPVTANAEEGGTGHYIPGNVATLIDLAPSQPGWIIQPLYLYYDADYNRNRKIPVGGILSTGLDVTVNSITLGGLYSLEPKVFGATYSAGIYVPFVWMDVTGTINGSSRTDSVSGLSDISVIPVILAWKADLWQYDISFPIYTPTGEYKVNQLANLGLNYWTFDPTIGITYGNPETGFNAALHAGITFNTKNPDTDYDSGSVLHGEISVQQLLPSTIGIFGLGINAFIYEQITDDSGAGATNGAFQGHSLGIGPVLDYMIPTENNGTFVFEARWLPELDTENRVKGDYFWMKGTWQF